MHCAYGSAWNRISVAEMRVLPRDRKLRTEPVYRAALLAKCSVNRYLLP
jgi:hypothetical protein